MPLPIRVGTLSLTAKRADIRRIFATCVFFLGCVMPLGAQPTLPLPHFDGVTGFYRAGRLSGAKPVKPCPSHFSPDCGWGFEALGEIGMTKEDAEAMLKEARSVCAEAIAMLQEAESMRSEARAMRAGGDPVKKAQADEKDAQADQKTELANRKIEEGLRQEKRANERINRWRIFPRLELAVGYDFLNIDRVTKDYEIITSAQTLPSLELYLDWDVKPYSWIPIVPAFDVYGGVGTGRVVLKNAKVFDGKGSQYSINPDPEGFPFVWSAGLTCCGNRSTEKSWPLRLFVEYSHETRSFPTVTFVPANEKFPLSLSVSGYVVNLGFEVIFPKAPQTQKQQ
jgi:hypothetical protein